MRLCEGSGGGGGDESNALLLRMDFETQTDIEQLRAWIRRYLFVLDTARKPSPFVRVPLPAAASLYVAAADPVVRVQRAKVVQAPKIGVTFTRTHCCDSAAVQADCDLRQAFNDSVDAFCRWEKTVAISASSRVRETDQEESFALQSIQ